MSRKKDLLLSIAFAGAALLFPIAAQGAVNRDERPSAVARDVELVVREAHAGAAMRAGVRSRVDPLGRQQAMGSA